MAVTFYSWFEYTIDGGPLETLNWSLSSKSPISYIHGEAIRQAVRERYFAVYNSYPSGLDTPIEHGTPLYYDWAVLVYNYIYNLIPYYIDYRDNDGEWIGQANRAPLWTVANIYNACTTTYRINIGNRYNISKLNWFLQQKELLSYMIWTSPGVTQSDLAVYRSTSGWQNSWDDAKSNNNWLNKYLEAYYTSPCIGTYGINFRDSEWATNAYQGHSKASISGNGLSTLTHNLLLYIKGTLFPMSATINTYYDYGLGYPFHEYVVEQSWTEDNNISYLSDYITDRDIDIAPFPPWCNEPQDDDDITFNGFILDNANWFTVCKYNVSGGFTLI